MNDEDDFLVESYDFDLPEERIAQFPCADAGNSRLLVMDRIGPSGETQPAFADARFADLASYLPSGCLIVANNTKVLPARMPAIKSTGARVEFLLLTPLPLLLAVAQNHDSKKIAEVECLLRPASKIRLGDKLDLAPDLRAEIIEKGEFGRHRAILSWQGDLEKIFDSTGSLPLPPYIRRKTEKMDSDRYQTIYAKKTGAVAAPTAGLHFTSAIRDSLAAAGCLWRELTLYVGYGTFSPVRVADIRDHKMHAEYVEVPEETAKAVAQAKAEERPIIAVGTTSLRALEGVAAQLGHVGAWSGWTDIFLYPGKKFRIVNGLITNFHLPRSTLLMLVSAFAGRKRILSAYCHAARLGYKFFSYGDAMLIRP